MKHMPTTSCKAPMKTLCINTIVNFKSKLNVINDGLKAGKKFNSVTVN